MTGAPEAERHCNIIHTCSGSAMPYLEYIIFNSQTLLSDSRRDLSLIICTIKSTSIFSLIRDSTPRQTCNFSSIGVRYRISTCGLC